MVLRFQFQMTFNLRSKASDNTLTFDCKGGGWFQKQR